jgi:hypothetical protein
MKEEHTVVYRAVDSAAFTQGRTANLETHDRFQSAVTVAPTSFEALRSPENVRRKE